MSRQLIVVDVETTGLDPRAHILEVAAVNVTTGEELAFVPHVDFASGVYIEPFALAVNRYFERKVFQQALSPNETRAAYTDLRDMLKGNTFAGSNPAFDSRLIGREIPDQWHHRLADLAAYAAAKFGLPPTELPGLDDVMKRLGIEIEERHSALADARATAEAFRRLEVL